MCIILVVSGTQEDLLTTEVIGGKEEDAYIGQDMNAAAVTGF